MEVDGADAGVTLVKLQAGILNYTDGVLQADTSKGALEVAQTEDTLTHVRWYKRDVGSPDQADHDIVVFPGECSLEQLPGQPRCYILQFPEDRSRDMFFWGQQSKVDEEVSLVQQFNKALRGEVLPPAPAPAPPVPAPSAAPAQSSRAAVNPDLAAILSSALSAAGAGASPGSSGAAGTPDVSALAASLLQQMAAQGHGGLQPDQGPSLHEVLKPEQLIPLVQEPGMLEQLAPHLPEEHRSLDQLIATLRSPQFQQQVASFSMALQTGQLDLGQFGLQAKGFSVADFLEAVQDMVNRQKGVGGSKP